MQLRGITAADMYLSLRVVTAKIDGGHVRGGDHGRRPTDGAVYIGLCQMARASSFTLGISSTLLG